MPRASTVFPFEDGNDLVVYPLEDYVHPYEWIQPDDDDPSSYIVPNNGGYYDEYEEYLADEAYRQHLEDIANNPY